MAKSQKKNTGPTAWAMPEIPGAKKRGVNIAPPPKKSKKKPAKKKA